MVRVPTKPTRPKERWAIDFMSDALISGRKFRVLTVIDLYSREALAVSARMSFPATEVTTVLDRIGFNRSKPVTITPDNGTEFAGKHFDAWAYQRNIKLDFIRPGKPIENCFIESFNGRVRDECLSMHWFESLDEARSILEDWRRDHNQTRPHSSLLDRVPKAYLESLLEVGIIAPKEATT